MTEKLEVKATCPECGGRRVTAPANRPFPRFRFIVRLMAGDVTLTCESCGFSD